MEKKNLFKTCIAGCGLLTAVTLLTGCSSDDTSLSSGPVPVPAPVAEERIPLAVGFSDTGAATEQPVGTRANTDGSGNSNFFNSGVLSSDYNTKIGLFSLIADAKSVTDASWEKWNWQSNSFSAVATNYSKIAWSSGNEIYYPEVKTEKVSLYAYYPYITTPASYTDITNTTLFELVRLPLNQTDLTSYRQADVLWGCAGSGANTGYVAKSVDIGGAYALLSKTGEYNNTEVSANQYITVRNGSTAANTKAPGTTYLQLESGGRKTPAVIIPMLHRGAKIVVRVTTKGMNFDKLKNANVRMLWPSMRGILTMSTGGFTAKGTQETASDWTTLVTAGTAKKNGENYVYNVTLTDHLGITAQATNTEEGKVTESTVSYYTCTGIVVPGTSNTAFNLFEVDLYDKIAAHTAADGANPVTGTYGWKPAAAVTFESGKKYVFDVTVTAVGLEVVMTILDWVAGTHSYSSTTNTAEMQ